MTCVQFDITLIQGPHLREPTKLDAAQMSFEQRADSETNSRLETINSALNTVLEVAKDVAELNNIAGVVVKLVDKLQKVGSITEKFLVALTVC